MLCPTCGTETPAPAVRCQTCRTPFAGMPAITAADASALAVTRVVETTTRLTAGGTPHAGGPLAPGEPFGTRYRILRELGAGGMGVVYQAWDAELGVAVALKVIRPEVSADPYAAREVERRFKRELLLARQVTHKHVVRIHDLGEIDGIKYLTMPYIEGRDLAHVLRDEGPMAVRDAVRIAKQLCSGLLAAHEAGVVHRDLKPENVMLDQDGQAQIMDFGISRSVTAPAGTMTSPGSVMGTLEYMAPEQARGVAVDHRADIYAFGLILHDMLVGGRRMAGADSALAEMMARMQRAPAALRTARPDVPEPLERIVTKCLQPDVDQRYATTAALVADVEALDDAGQARPAPALPRSRATVIAASIAFVAVITAVTLWWTGRRAPIAPPAGAREPISVLVADFDNNASDPVFDGLVEQALTIGIESASFVTVFPRRDAMRLAASQFGGNARLTRDRATLLSLSQGINVIVDGSIAREASGGYKLSVYVARADGTARPLLEDEVRATDRNVVLTAVGRLAAKVRGALGDTDIDSAAFGAETFTAASLEAASAYAKAQDLVWSGRSDAAIAQYREAIRLDPHLGRAYAGLAALYSNAGQHDLAVEYYQKALQEIDRMTEREKFRTRGGFYLLTRDSARAIAQFKELTEKYPSDSAGLANLAVAEVYERHMKSALEIGRRAAAIYPKNVIRRSNVALFAMYAGEFETAEREAAEALKLNAEYPKAMIARAMAQLGSGRPADAEATLRALDAMPGPRTFSTAGLADLAMYRGQLSEARTLLERRGAGSAPLTVTLAEVRLLQGDTAAAASLASAAVKESTDPAVLFLAARILAAAKRPEAGHIAASLAASLDREPHLYGTLLEGELALLRGDIRAAVGRFEDAQKIADSWIGHFDLGRANLAAGRFPEAHDEFDVCLKRRGEATAAFLDEIPTYRFLPPVHYYMALAQSGLKSPEAATSLRTFLEIKKAGDEQGLVTDARRRLSH